MKKNIIKGRTVGEKAIIKAGTKVEHGMKMLITRVTKWSNPEILYGSNKGHAGIDWSFMRDLKKGECIVLNAGYSYAHLRAKYYGIKISLHSEGDVGYEKIYTLTRIK